jgi:hypothetical protein
MRTRNAGQIARNPQLTSVQIADALQKKDAAKAPRLHAACLVCFEKTEEIIASGPDSEKDKQDPDT